MFLGLRMNTIQEGDSDPYSVLQDKVEEKRAVVDRSWHPVKVSEESGPDDCSKTVSLLKIIQHRDKSIVSGN